MPNNDSHQHVVKTTSQWNDRAVEYWVIPRGCLCIELTPEGKTKLKVGEGNKFYHQLPYVCEGSDLSNYYTKEEIDNIIDNINRMAIMSTDEYDSKNDLPLDGNKLGDVRFVKSSTPSISTEPDVYLWNGTKWIFVGTDISSIDLDDFVKKEEFEVVKDKVDIMYPKMHEHDNKDILDQTTAPFTIPEKEKLAGLENYDDTEIRELIHETGHTHPNKALLDTITPSSLWNEADRIKFNDLHNYDDTEVIVRIETLEEKSHTHSNKNILDQITAPFQVADKEKLDSLQNYDVFRGTDGIYPGGKGLVPGPTIADSGKFLSSSGEWLPVTVVANDFIGATENTDGEHGLVPAPLAGEQSYYLRGDGTWAMIEKPIEYKAGAGISINDTSFELNEDTVTNIVYLFDTQVTSSVSGRIYTKYNTEPALGAIVYYASSYTQPFFVGLTTDSVKYGTNYDSHIWPDPDHPPFEYKGVTWYYSGNAYGMPGDVTDSSGHMQKLPGNYSVATEEDLQNIARAIIDAADIITDPTKIISAKISEGLSFDSNDAIQNEGLLSVTQDFDDKNHLTFGTVYGDIDITIPGGEPTQYVRVSTTDSFVLLHTKPADWDDTWYKYYMLSYDELVDEPPNWDPTRHYKYENDNYVLGSPGDTFVSTTWYDKHYNGLDPNTPIIFDSDVYYTSTLNLIQDGELFDTAFEKVNEAIEHIERLEQNVQFLHDNKVDVRETIDSERIEFYYS